MVVGYSARDKVSLALNCALPGQWLTSMEGEKVSGVSYASGGGNEVGKTLVRICRNQLPSVNLFRDSE